MSLNQPDVTDTDSESLDSFEIRVLAVLAEKEALTPDNYPLSLNTLISGCNQLSSRDPVMAMPEPLVQDVLQRLVVKKLVNEVHQAGARVARYEHRLRIKWSLPQAKLAVLVTLMLRGMQTAGEVRVRSGRLQEFANATEVEAGLQFLIDKYPPLVIRLARSPGSKEVRYAHLLGGAAAFEPLENATDFGFQSRTVVSGGDRICQLEQEVADLRSELQQLIQQFEHFKKQFD